MKKSILAVAGLATVAGIATAPIAGVFATADDSVTDKLTVTIDRACTLARTGAAADGASYADGAYSRTMVQNELKDLGTSTFTVKCNTTGGYTVTGTFGTLTSENSDTITYKNAAAAAEDGKWSAKIDTDTYISSGGTVKTASSETTASGDTFTVKYSVGTTTNQASGSYTNASAAVYELTGNPAA